jgi:hypothetical protein
LFGRGLTVVATRRGGNYSDALKKQRMKAIAGGAEYTTIRIGFNLYDRRRPAGHVCSAAPETFLPGLP